MEKHRRTYARAKFAPGIQAGRVTLLISLPGPIADWVIQGAPQFRAGDITIPNGPATNHRIIMRALWQAPQSLIPPATSSPLSALLCAGRVRFGVRNGCPRRGKAKQSKSTLRCALEAGIGILNDES